VIYTWALFHVRSMDFCDVFRDEKLTDRGDENIEFWKHFVVKHWTLLVCFMCVLDTTHLSTFSCQIDGFLRCFSRWKADWQGGWKHWILKAFCGETLNIISVFYVCFRHDTLEHFFMSDRWIFAMFFEMKSWLTGGMKTLNSESILWWNIEHY
jgi:hypothetical protein